MRLYATSRLRHGHFARCVLDTTSCASPFSCRLVRTPYSLESVPVALSTLSFAHVFVFTPISTHILQQLCSRKVSRNEGGRYAHQEVSTTRADIDASNVQSELLDAYNLRRSGHSARPLHPHGTWLNRMKLFYSHGGFIRSLARAI